MKFPLPDAALAQHVAFLGKTGAGKSTTVKGAVEHIVRTMPGARVCILDPIKSDWWGLTSSADGKHPGLPFHILGGPRGHVPLHASAGKAIGELVGSGALPLSIIDMADFPPGGLSQFFNDFAPALMRSATGVIYLILEEAHEFAPKERAGVGAETMAIYHAKKLATAGRSKGIRLMVLTQRTQALHNAILGSCDTMVAHRLTAPADQGPVKDWLKAQFDKATFERVAGSLASLPTGSAWVCSGEAQLAQLVAFPRIATFDNSATPAIGGQAREVATAPVDKERLRAIIGTAVQEAEANDPKALHKRIRELEAEAAKKAAAGPMVDPSVLEAAQQAGYRDGYRTGRMHAFGRAEGDLVAIDRALADLRMGWTAEKNGPLPEGFGANSKEPPGRASAARAETSPRQNAHSTGTSSAHRTTSLPAGPKSSTLADGLTRPQQRILDALAWLRSVRIARADKAQLAIMADQSPTSGSYMGALAAMLKLGLITYPAAGVVEITEAGADKANAAQTPPTTAGLHASLERKLPAPQWKTLRAIIDVYPASISKSDLAATTGQSPTSGSYMGNLAALNKIGFVSYPSPGQVAALPILFVERQ
ncbi:Helicase HerA, central domain containing protein [uncultured Caudovirales phage]|uniref:Helicase HerA, central domain containing protein n=1 Tax=uncultured Caudovirales phage TaxID=2100421 RepID=A0A6J5T6P5_9CAUD|nr:Helicase HerA, central domain containing protein [uncultured Caudovirales phage]CAB4195587.1 Helicase HerA, central domain containing protein [uncultured Caudovirales phage]CAB4222554.1 Helicase HerA, central domain containing protein [uncultured Caudovirales phage]